MYRLELTLPTAAENVALDEALLDMAEESSHPCEILRIWELTNYMVVAGRSTRIAQEINRPECDARRIPIIRRSSGGAAIVTGPGCLMYAVVLSYELRPDLRDIGKAHCFVLGRLAESLRASGLAVAQAGTSDLVIADCGLPITDCSSTSQSAIRNPQSEIHSARKFSGNSLRAKRTHFLYHGTLLYDFDLSLLAACLRMPPRQPDYRSARDHLDFVANLPLSRFQLITALHAAWPTTEELTNIPLHRVQELVATRFSQDSWNNEFA
jgi:lipoate-protein ligase A